MSKGVCASCITFSIDNIVKSQQTLKPTWLHKFDYVEEFIKKQTDFKLKKPTSYDAVAILEMKKMANKRILYWAANPSRQSNILINDAKTAYGNFENFGVAQCDENGKVRVYFKFPQIYSTIQKGEKKRQTYHPHLHFVIANNDNSSWCKQIYTKIVIKHVNFNQMEQNKKDNTTVFLNTLPCEYYAQDHIPNSFNLYYKEIKKMSVDQLNDWFSIVIKRHYPELHKVVSKRGLSIYEVPIVCYCAHKDCNASELALEELAKKGFVNVSLYEGGMKEYNQKHKLN
jgi:rhodanese-related sulfurtransferase